VEWEYFVARAEDGTILSIARRQGPTIEVLTHEGEWLERPELLTRFQDPDYFDPVPLADAAASTLGIKWPA